MKNVVPFYPESPRPDGQRPVTVADLEAFGEKMLTNIRQLLQANGAITTKKWLKSHQVRRLLNISAGTLQTLRDKGTLPYTRIGGILYYDAAEIDRILKKGA